MAYEKLNLKNGHTLTAEDIAHMEKGIFDAYTGITRVESLDKNNLTQLRDLETGLYVLYGYFSPFVNSNISLSFDNAMVVVSRKSAGSHLLVFTGLNSVVNFLEILVDNTNEKGFTYNRTNINLLDLHKLIGDVGEPHKQMVTDGDGNATWVDLLCYEEEGSALLDDTITFGDGGQVIVETVLDIVGGNTYNVYWNGTVYQCKATFMSADGQTGVLLGDFSLLSGGSSTGEPFVVSVVETAGTMIVALDGSASATVKIAKVDLRKLPEKFYDADPPYIDLAAYGFGEPVEETQIKTFSEIGLSAQEVLELHKKAEKLHAVFAVPTAANNILRKCFGTANMITIDGTSLIYYTILVVQGGLIESLEVSFSFEPDGSGEILVRDLGQIDTTIT